MEDHRGGTGGNRTVRDDATDHPGAGGDQHRMVGHRTLARRAARFSQRRAVTSRVRWSANGPRCQLPGTVRTEIPSGAGRSGFLCRITTARPGNACNALATLTADSGSRIAAGSGCAKAHPGATCRSQTGQPSVALDLREVGRRVERGLDEHQRRRRQRRSGQRGHRGAESDTGDRPSLAVRSWCRAVHRRGTRRSGDRRSRTADRPRCLRSRASARRAPCPRGRSRPEPADGTTGVAASPPCPTTGTPAPAVKWWAGAAGRATHTGGQDQNGSTEPPAGCCPHRDARPCPRPFPRQETTEPRSAW